MEGCGMNFIKYLLVVFNGFFLIFGIVIIATACVDMDMLMNYSGQTSFETDALLIAIGVMIIIISAFGCFGAWKESPKLLYIFAGCLIVIILLELSAGIAAAVLRPQIEGSVKKHLRFTFTKNKSVGNEDLSQRKFWDQMQSNLECCGSISPSDYLQPPSIKQPPSCCPPSISGDSDEVKHSRCISDSLFYKEGCEEKVLTTLHSAGLTVIVCGILFCFLEVAGIVLALWLAHSIKTQGKSRETA